MTKCGKHHEFREHLLPIVFLIDIHKGTLSIEKTDEEQSKLLSKSNKRIKIKFKKLFLKNARFFLNVRLDEI